LTIKLAVPHPVPGGTHYPRRDDLCLYRKLHVIVCFAK